ncbi:MAG: peptide chain release factor N(5)-glutamine methyltransferase [Microthrixaceae bacterium]|nr:peptide chain release factor N(5)-glutamine methyltransferase [Microthrixaceae bacterium]
MSRCSTCWVTGGFRQLDLMVDSRVLIPRPETESVVDVCLAELDRLGGRDLPTTVVDLGTGSGAIALAVATERVRTTVWATDESEDALGVARANLAGVGRAAARVRMVAGDWYTALPTDLAGSVQVLVSNPPYVAETAELPAEVADWEPSGALRSGPDGLDDLRRIIAGALDGSKPTARWCARSHPSRPARSPSLRRAASAKCVSRSDLTGRSRALVARRPID